MDALASSWPDFVSDVGAAPVKFDPQFLASLKPAEFGLYGRNTRGLLRNQVEDTRSAEKVPAPGLQAPKFLSEKARESAKGGVAGTSSVEEDVGKVSSDPTAMEADSSMSEMPPNYRMVEIKYSKFGVDDFDFG